METYLYFPRSFYKNITLYLSVCLSIDQYIILSSIYIFKYSYLKRNNNDCTRYFILPNENPGIGFLSLHIQTVRSHMSPNSIVIVIVYHLDQTVRPYCYRHKYLNHKSQNYQSGTGCDVSSLLANIHGSRRGCACYQRKKINHKYYSIMNLASYNSDCPVNICLLYSSGVSIIRVINYFQVKSKTYCTR